MGAYGNDDKQQHQPPYPFFPRIILPPGPLSACPCPLPRFADLAAISMCLHGLLASSGKGLVLQVLPQRICSSCHLPPCALIILFSPVSLAGTWHRSVCRQKGVAGSKEEEANCFYSHCWQQQPVSLCCTSLCSPTGFTNAQY